MHAPHWQSACWPSGACSGPHAKAHGPLAPVALAPEVKVEVEDAALKGALEALLVAVLPLLVQDLERDVLIGGTGVEAQQAGAAVLVRVRVLQRAAAGFQGYKTSSKKP